MIKILIVEDERPISELLRLTLTGEGYHCECAYDGGTAADMIERGNFDLALLDIMLPVADGYELLDYVKLCGIPAIFITAKTGVSDRVRGLRAGAEDYISKPFEIDELTARVETVLRRYGKSVDIISFGDIKIDARSHIVTKAGVEVALTAKEFDLLIYLYNNKNKALYRSQIYARVWGSDFLGDSRTVDLHVQRLRRKLSLEGALVSVYKIGYRLDVKE